MYGSGSPTGTPQTITAAVRQAIRPGRNWDKAPAPLDHVEDPAVSADPDLAADAADLSPNAAVRGAKADRSGGFR